MDSNSTERSDIAMIAQKAHEGADVSEHFTGRFQVKQNVTIDFPLALLRTIDDECQRRNMSRQDWIKQVCAEQVLARSQNVA